MRLKIALTKVTGTPDHSGWSQVHDFEPEDKEKLTLRGRLLAVIATKGAKNESDGVILGREILARLHEEYFGKKDVSAFHALKEAVDKVIREFSVDWEGVEIAAATYVKDVVYTAVGGGGEASLFRDKMLAKILVSQKEQAVAASGYPKEGDVLLLGTSAFFKVFTEEVIRASLKTGDLNKASESWAATAHSVKDSGTIAGVAILFSSDKNLTQLLPSQKITPVKTKINTQKTKLILLIDKLLEKLPSPKIYIKRKEEDLAEAKRRKTVLSAGFILLILLIISIGFGIKQKLDKDKRAKYEERLTRAVHQFDEAVKLVSINPERARELFTESFGLVEELTNEGVKDEKLKELKEKLKEKEGEILGEYRLEAELFLDLSLLSSGFKPSQMDATNERILILDKEGKKLVTVDIFSKKTEVVAGPEQIDKVDQVFGYADRVFFANDEGVFEVNKKIDKVIEADWQGQVLVKAYAGNIYVLDKADSKIYRYAGTASGFGSKNLWFSKDVDLDLSQVDFMAIDGSIWLATPEADVLKFNQGVRQTFKLKGVFPEIKNLKAIYTNEELKGLYLFEEGRIVVVNKEGEFLASYLNDQLKDSFSLAVSEAEKKVFFLEDEKLYFLPLRHLK